MRLEDFPSKEGKKVWLDHGEVELFTEQAESTEQSIAFDLMARCGLRRKEAVAVTPPDVVRTDVGPRIRVWEGKGDKHREVPATGDLATSARVLGEQRDEANDVPLVDVSTRTVERWVRRAAERCQAESDDVGWQYLRPHDLRRTWGTLLVEAGVEPGMIMVWGGWEDWETFREHYLGAYSPEMERRQAAMVPWLNVRNESGQNQQQPGGRFNRR